LAINDNDDEDEGKVLLSLLDLAVKFNVEGLADECLSGLKSVISLQNVFEVYKKGRLHGKTELYQSALQFILRLV
jgi:hypothetical protein